VRLEVLWAASSFCFLGVSAKWVLTYNCHPGQCPRSRLFCLDKSFQGENCACDQQPLCMELPAWGPKSRAIVLLDTAEAGTDDVFDLENTLRAQSCPVRRQLSSWRISTRQMAKRRLPRLQRYAMMTVLARPRTRCHQGMVRAIGV
jgi:hypothetical protein